MKKEELLSKKVITRNYEELEVIDVTENDDLKEVRIKLSNEKIYSVYLAFKSGYLRFIEENINKKITYFLEEEIELIKKQELIEEEKKLKLIEEREKEKELMKNSISRFRDEYEFLSNFYKREVTYKGITYKNNEAAFQAQKDLSRSIEFKDLNPVVAKRLGKKVNLRSDWEEVKLGIMEEILRCKFDQNPDLKEKLIETNDRLLIEGNTWNDTYWGVSKGNGKNNLGKLLMKLRKEYQDTK